MLLHNLVAKFFGYLNSPNNQTMLILGSIITKKLLCKILFPWLLASSIVVIFKAYIWRKIRYLKDSHYSYNPTSTFGGLLVKRIYAWYSFLPIQKAEHTCNLTLSVSFTCPQQNETKGTARTCMIPFTTNL